MKKASIIIFVTFLGFATKSFSQETSSVDFFAGKWEISLLGLPQGDTKLVTDLVRVDGNLTGVLSDPENSESNKLKITNIKEGEEKIEIFFFAEGYDVSIGLTKVDEDNLKGYVMDMFPATAVRIID